MQPRKRRRRRRGGRRRHANRRRSQTRRASRVPLPESGRLSRARRRPRRRRLARALRRRRALRLRVPAPPRRRDVLSRAREAARGGADPRARRWLGPASRSRSPAMATTWSRSISRPRCSPGCASGSPRCPARRGRADRGSSHGDLCTFARDRTRRRVPARDRGVQLRRAPLHARRGRRRVRARRRAPGAGRRVRVRRPAAGPRVADPRPDEALGQDAVHRSDDRPRDVLLDEPRLRSDRPDRADPASTTSPSTARARRGS